MDPRDSFPCSLFSEWARPPYNPANPATGALTSVLSYLLESLFPYHESAASPFYLLLRKFPFSTAHTASFSPHLLFFFRAKLLHDCLYLSPFLAPSASAPVCNRLCHFSKAILRKASNTHVTKFRGLFFPPCFTFSHHCLVTVDHSAFLETPSSYFERYGVCLVFLLSSR